VTSFGGVVPLLTPELFFVATVRTEDVELGKRPRDSGVDLKALEEVAIRPLEIPDKLMF
jgi:hypothetical protein